jgi:hypothetical protein
MLGRWVFGLPGSVAKADLRAELATAAPPLRRPVNLNIPRASQSDAHVFGYIGRFGGITGRISETRCGPSAVR